MLGEILAFVLYFLAMLAVGAYFMFKKKAKTQSDYFLGGRAMGPYVTALSAQASDMSSWLLMGLPGSIVAVGFGEVWIAIGLAIGTYLNWLLIAGRLRKFSQAAGDAITIPQYLNNRFKAKGKTLQIVSAVIFFVFFTVYVASILKGGATLFDSVLGVNNQLVSMIIFTVILLAYTFMGGFNAVCWTDLIQSLLMLVAITFIPLSFIIGGQADLSVTATGGSFNLLSSGRFDWASISTILNGLAWGLGYCGMPHIIIRFMSIKNSKMVKTSRRVASVWVVITLAMAVLVGLVGASVMPELVTNGQHESVFILLARKALPPFLAGICMSAILAASMSTADSQLLVASSAVACDIYKPIVKKDASEKEVLWVGRIVIVLISVIAFVIASIPALGNIMDLVSYAWAGFGGAFGPVIVLSLFWKKLTYKGAVTGMIVGGLTVILWILFLSGPTGVYELIPAFILGLLACIVVSIIDKKNVAPCEEMFNEAIAFDDSVEQVKG